VKSLLAFLIGISVICGANTVNASDGVARSSEENRSSSALARYFSAHQSDEWYLGLSPVTHHYNPSNEHSPVWLIGIQRIRKSRDIVGIAYFSNSFQQPSVFIYPWGKIYRNFLGRPNVFAQWGAGLLYGYRDPYEDKVPFNHNGYSPGYIISLGYQFDNRIQTKLNLLGTAGIMFQVSLPLN
jgi:hypothetical protein